MTQQPALVPITYFGRRHSFYDRLYGSGLEFTKGQTRSVPTELARKFLRHADQFECGKDEALTSSQQEAAPPADDTAAVLAEAEAKKLDEAASQSRIQDLYDQVNTMDKDALASFAMTNYRHDFDKRQSVTKLREQAIGLIDQFGAV